MRKLNYIQIAETEFWTVIRKEDLRRLEQYLGTDRKLVSEERNGAVYWTIEHVEEPEGPYAKYWKP